jgi:gamma-glutamylcyclotransferase (GGCT)/AIG2-like uncharacterized protein YtfP
MQQKRITAFVYGTLKVGLGFSWRLDEFRVESIPGKIKASLFDGIYPMIMDGNDEVYGEIHIYENEGNTALDVLDQIEGYLEGNKNNLYERRIVDALGEDGKTYQAYAYFIAVPSEIKKCENGTYKKIKDGVWTP